MQSAIKDVCAIAGLALVGLGCYLIYAPLAPLVLGALLLVAGVWGHFHDSQ